LASAIKRKGVPEMRAVLTLIGLLAVGLGFLYWGQGGTTGLLVFAAIALYLLPWYIAVLRDAKHTLAIFLVNLLLGWTVVGWLAAFIWAVVEKTEEPVATTTNARVVDGKILPYDAIEEAKPLEGLKALWMELRK
jgi:hypothetical protein